MNQPDWDDLRYFLALYDAGTLTAAGKALVPHARQMEAGLHGVLRVATGAAALSGTVRVSAPPALAAYLLAPRLKAALHRLPGIELDLRGEARETDLMRRESDIALRFNRPTAPGLAVRALFQAAAAGCGVAVLPEYFAASSAATWWPSTRQPVRSGANCGSSCTRM
jgi:DNA-binding transcriptional LysR family regulator